jgi:hypothetical protein
VALKSDGESAAKAARLSTGDVLDGIYTGKRRTFDRFTTS